MTIDDHQGEQRPDWLIPAIAVGVAVLVLVGVGVIVALTRSSSEPETLPEQLEAYTTCLRSNGANVPLVEARNDGGVAIVLDGGLLDGGFDLAGLGDAVAACADEAPGQLGFLSSLVGGLQGFDLGGLHGFDPGNRPGFDLGGLQRFEHDGPRGFGSGSGPGPGFGFDEEMPGEICGALADGSLPPDLPGMDRLRDVCEATGA